VHKRAQVKVFRERDLEMKSFQINKYKDSITRKIMHLKVLFMR